MYFLYFLTYSFVFVADFFDNASNKPTNIDSRKNNPGAGKDIKSPEK